MTRWEITHWDMQNTKDRKEWAAYIRQPSLSIRNTVWVLVPTYNTFHKEANAQQQERDAARGCLLLKGEIRLSSRDFPSHSPKSFFFFSPSSPQSQCPSLPGLCWHLPGWPPSVPKLSGCLPLVDACRLCGPRALINRSLMGSLGCWGASH